MGFILVLNTLSLSFAGFASRKRHNILLFFSFSILFLFLAFRYKYGNDYENYQTAFQKIADLDLRKLLANDLDFEFGFILLCKLFAPFGFQFFIATCSLFYLWSINRAIKAFVPGQYIWFSYFIFIFNPELFLLNLSAIRQSLAISLFLLALPYLMGRKPWKYFMVILLAIPLHYSAIILLPLSLLLIKPITSRRVVWAAVAGYFFLYFFAGPIINSIFSYLVRNYALLSKYKIYDDGATGAGRSLIGMAFATVVFFLLLFRAKGKDSGSTIVKNGAIMFFYIVFFTKGIQILSRMSLYFAPFLMLAYPAIIDGIRNKHQKYLFIFTILGYYSYQMFSFFSNPTYSDHYAQYRTILEVLP